MLAVAMLYVGKGRKDIGYSSWRLRFEISSSLNAAIQRHLLTTLGSGLKLYLELASRRRKRLLTIVAAV